MCMYALPLTTSLCLTSQLYVIILCCYKTVIYIGKLIMFPLWLAIVIIFYFLSGYWLWKLKNIFYYCEKKIKIHILKNYVHILLWYKFKTKSQSWKGKRVCKTRILLNVWKAMGNDFFNGESILKPFFTLNIKKVKILKSPRTLQGQV